MKLTEYTILVGGYIYFISMISSLIESCYEIVENSKHEQLYSVIGKTCDLHDLINCRVISLMKNILFSWQHFKNEHLIEITYLHHKPIHLCVITV